MPQGCEQGRRDGPGVVETMTVIEQMRALAETENAVARLSWGQTPRRRLAVQIEPYCGSGLSTTEVARLIGCSQPAVRKVLNSKGWEL